MNLADRVRGVLRPSAPAVTIVNAHYDEAELERTLGGEWRTIGDAAAFVVERRTSGDETYGRTRVADIGGRLDAHAAQASMLTGPTVGGPPCLPFVFFDLETTGLSGGAGTYAFLVGFGAFADDGAFVVRQYLMTKHSDERPMLQTIARELGKAGALVSFNGKSFDAPLLETRYSYHRLEWSGARIAHLDALHPARQFWGAPGLRGPADVHQANATDVRRADLSGPPKSGCSLISLETQVLGTRRVGDVPGFEIPARYFQFIRSGDARPLTAVLEHNRRDLLSLAGLTARLLQLVAGGPDEAGDAREALALGRVYSRSRRDEQARDAFRRAVEMTGARPHRGAIGAVRIAALHGLAICERRARRYDEAASRWRAMLDIPECPGPLAREATEALAIHHEHRVRDLPVARMFALRSLETGTGRAWQDAVRRRLTRIDRKMERSGGLRLE